MLNLTTTQSTGVEFYQTKPFFLDAPYYANKYNQKYGLRNGIRSVDDTYIYIEPHSGTVFKNYLPYQLAFKLFPVDVSDFGNLPEIDVPVARTVINAYAPDNVVASYQEMLELLDTYTIILVYLNDINVRCCRKTTKLIATKSTAPICIYIGSFQETRKYLSRNFVRPKLLPINYTNIMVLK